MLQRQRDSNQEIPVFFVISKFNNEQYCLVLESFTLLDYSVKL